MSRQDNLTRRIWFGLLDSERTARYFRVVSDRHRRRYHCVAMTIGIGSVLAASCTTAALFTGVDVFQWLSITFSGITGAAVVWLLRNNDARVLAQSESASLYYTMMYRQWRHVWDNRRDPNDAANIQLLEERMHAGPNVDLADDEALNYECYLVANRVVESEFVHAA